jgi:hypothetical protein
VQRKGYSFAIHPIADLADALCHVHPQRTVSRADRRPPQLLFAYLSGRPSVCLLACLFVCLFVCLFAYSQPAETSSGSPPAATGQPLPNPWGSPTPAQPAAAPAGGAGAAGAGLGGLGGMDLNALLGGLGATPTTSAPRLGSPLPHLHRDWAHPCHIRDWAHPSHICTGI